MDLPAEVRDKVALCLQDFISCCFTALDGPGANAMLAIARGRPGLPEAFHWGLDLAVSAECAALGNGMLGHGLIREDIHVSSGAHAGVTILPALLALAQRDKLSGKALVRGIVAGYQLMTVLGMAVRTGVTNRHFRPLGISGAFGAAAGAIAAHLVDEEHAVHALAFAANFASGLNQWPWSGGQEIYVHPGMAARNALTALDLARAGLTSSEDILEGPDGLFAAYGSGDNAPARFREELGPSLCILDVRHKPVAGCNMIQTPVAAALDLRRRIGATGLDGIEKITLSTFAAARRYPGCDNAGPFTSLQQSKMSLQYGVAAALLFGELNDASYSRFEDGALKRLIAKIEIVILPEYDAVYPRAQPGCVELRLQSGTTARCALPDVPWLDAADVGSRFDREVLAKIGNVRMRRVKELLHSLWDLPDTTALFDALRGDLAART